MTSPPDIRQLLPDFQELHHALDAAFTTMEWAEEEIDAAKLRHPAAADRIWSSSRLLKPTLDLMRTEIVYRAHCRELLDRVAAGQDTRPGTAAECCIALSEVSLQVPLNTTAAGLYARMWQQAGLPPGPLGDSSEHYEALEGPQIDDFEALLRTKLTDPERVLPDSTTPRPAST